MCVFLPVYRLSHIVVRNNTCHGLLNMCVVLLYSEPRVFKSTKSLATSFSDEQLSCDLEAFVNEPFQMQ